MLAVVADDHDMGVTHVIRGDDHLTNAFRQTQLFLALGWELPRFAHIPLIHGADGAKLSKRHGALGVDAYREMGFLPEALCNYLLRLGWSHGDEEIISRQQAIEWFDLSGVGKAAARFDFDKLTNLNGHYIRQADDERLTRLVMPLIGEAVDGNLVEGAENRVKRAMPDLKERAKTILELSENSVFYARRRPLPLNEKALKLLDGESRRRVDRLRDDLAAVDPWSVGHLEDAARRFAENEGVKLGQVAQPLRAALTGSTVSPPIFGVMEVLGREETLGRLEDAL